MSRVIKSDHLFTPDEIKYLEARNQYPLIESNKKEFGPGGPRENEKPEPEQEVVLHLDQDIYEHVVNMKITKLQNELRKIGLSTRGDEHELKARLAQFLQESRDSQ